MALKIGIACSTGGAALFAAKDIFDAVYPGAITLDIVTDRACGIETVCDTRQISYTRIEEKNKSTLSQRIADHFTRAGDVTLVMLYINRLMTADLFHAFPVVNMHPSLLPAYKGLDGLKQAYDAGAKFVGCSLHMIDETLDGGALMAQVCHPLPRGITLAKAESLSFCQKTYLGVLLFSWLKNNELRFDPHAGAPYEAIITAMAHAPYANPALTDAKLIKAYNHYLERQGYGEWRAL